MSPLPSSERRGYTDARLAVAPGGELSQLRALSGRGARVGALRAALGPGAVVDIDPLTRTPSNLMVHSGFLTRRSSAPAERVALRYVEENARLLGLRASDLSTFRLRRDYVDTFGTHHLSWVQSVDGTAVFGNGLRAHVSAEGRLIALQGSPVAGLEQLADDTPGAARLSAGRARLRAAQDVGGEVDDARSTRRASGRVVWRNGDRATPVWFVTPTGMRLGWATIVQASGSLSYSHVLDARSGAVLYRRDLVQHDRGDARVVEYYPGAPRGGRQKIVNLIEKGWLRADAPWLRGPNVSAWADVDDNNAVGPTETTPVPGLPGRAQFRLRPFNNAHSACSPRFVCTWDPDTPFSWRANKNADVTNGFFLANRFHDYLARRPIGFTAAAGNFERRGGDPVLLHSLDGANTAGGLPDGGHVNNANMSTPPDGLAPTMQMYLFHAPGASEAEDPFVPVSSDFDASILMHEYIHGLSNRLVVDAQGNSTLNSIQAGAMGEAWSDYYAMDYLVHRGLQRDSTARDGQVRIAKYTLADRIPFRTMAIDCDPGSRSSTCVQIDGKTRGGYTYGDFPTVIGTPQVHASGEIWAQTLWDMREALGHQVATALTTRAMELSRNDPTYLDMRNAILLADRVGFGGDHTGRLWRIFAARGMGWFAGAIDGGDAFPAEDFHVRPPASAGTGTLTGTVTDPVSGARVRGAEVEIAGHPTYTDVTDADGRYRISGVFPGLYPKVVVTARGHESVVQRVRVSAGLTRQGFASRRDWAARNGGAAVTSFTGPDFSPFGCGPEEVIDLSQAAGWVSTSGDDFGTPTSTPIPKRLVVRLPRAVDIGTGGGVRSAFKVDPSTSCGLAGSASTGDFTLEVSSAAAGPWTTVVDVSGADEWLPRFQFTELSASTAVDGVRFVRLTLRSPQVPDIATNCPDGAFDGCTFMAFTELEVFGEGR